MFDLPNCATCLFDNLKCRQQVWTANRTKMHQGESSVFAGSFKSTVNTWCCQQVELCFLDACINKESIHYFWYFCLCCGRGSLFDTCLRQIEHTGFQSTRASSVQLRGQLFITIKSVECGMATTRKQNEHLSMNDKSTSRPDVCTVMNDQGF